MASLFRPEVAEAQRQNWLGQVQLVRPLSMSVLTTAVLCALLLVLAFLFFGEYTRKARIGGVLVPDLGVIRLVPTASGRVLERHVHEGQAVRSGDLMFVLGVQSGTFSADVQQRVQHSLDERRRSLEESSRQQAQLADGEMQSLQRRLDALQREQQQLEAEGALHRQRLRLAQQSLERLEALSREQFISPAQVQTKKEEVIGLQAQVQALERQSAALVRDRALLEGERRGLPLQSKARQGAIERDLAALEREAAEHDAARQIVIRAPQDGTVSAVLAEAGQSVSPASALASLIPSGAKLQAHLFAPSGAVGFVRPDQQVRLRFEAFPYQKYGHQEGRVLQVSRTPLAAPELAALALPGPGAADANAEPMFRITVAMEPGGLQAFGTAQPLVAGMRMEADVLLERRRLVEWLFAPLLGLTNRL
ncbi:MAG TPA: HlyD family efflux transporter periplasmic adaptor subunit [Rubrivivax sp.]|nr:HlyD family efflux transporter periplasmic adaptor subunit [Rubrivivax sp.]HPO17566.1 HlyD family efflux transporter periplasmic adaptor subunit [Rubrivivax sp.]